MLGSANAVSINRPLGMLLLRDEERKAPRGVLNVVKLGKILAAMDPRIQRRKCPRGAACWAREKGSVALAHCGWRGLLLACTAVFPFPWQDGAGETGRSRQLKQKSTRWDKMAAVLLTVVDFARPKTRGVL